MTTSQYQNRQPILSALRNTRNPFILETVLAALVDQHSSTGAELRRSLSLRPSRADLHLLLPSYHAWPSEDQQAALSAARGAVQQLLRSLAEQPLSANEWENVGSICTKQLTEQLMQACQVPDHVLVQLALTFNMWRRTYASSAARDLLMVTPGRSPARFTYVASQMSSGSLMDIIRDGMDPELVAQHINPRTVDGAWAVLGTPAATDDRVRRWSGWFLQQHRSDYYRYSIPTSAWNLLGAPSTVTALLLGEAITLRGLVSSKTGDLRRSYLSAVELLDEENPSWRDELRLRSNPYLDSSDLADLAPRLPWNAELIGHRNANRSQMITLWKDQEPAGDALSDAVTSDRYRIEETAEALALGLQHHAPARISAGRDWVYLRYSIAPRREDLVVAVNALLDNQTRVNELGLDVQRIRQKMKYGFPTPHELTATASGSSPVTAPPVLSSIAQLELIFSLERWRYRSALVGRRKFELPQMYAVVADLSRTELDTFLGLANEWEDDLESLRSVAVALTAERPGAPSAATAGGAS